jgi:hypothetical protein
MIKESKVTIVDSEKVHLCAILINRQTDSGVEFVKIVLNLAERKLK